MRSNLSKQLIRQEGIKLSPYFDSKGVLTIGVGHNLTDGGITEKQALYILRDDIKLCRKELKAEFKFYAKLNRVRKDVMTNLCFNLGMPRLKKFVNMISALEVKDYETASLELLDSKWKREDVSESRSSELSEQLRTGKR